MGGENTLKLHFSYTVLTTPEAKKFCQVTTFISRQENTSIKKKTTTQLCALLMDIASHKAAHRCNDEESTGRDCFHFATICEME